MCVTRYLPDGEHDASMQVLNQLQPTYIYGSTTYLSYHFYFINNVLGYPQSYRWEYANTQQMAQFEALASDIVGSDGLNDWTGVTVFAPADYVWNTTSLLSNLTTQETAALFNNSVSYSLQRQAPTDLPIERSSMATQSGQPTSPRQHSSRFQDTIIRSRWDQMDAM